MNTEYGILERSSASDEVDVAVELLDLQGFADVPSGLAERELDTIDAAFDAVYHRQTTRFAADFLNSIDEGHTIRAPLALHPVFLELARHPKLLRIVRATIRGRFILNQQNGVINPPCAQPYNQRPHHRDLPYQHFTSSRPLAINALFCVDEFTAENGATRVLPASHKIEAFPSPQVVQAVETRIVATRGSFIVLDCMTFHGGGINRSSRARRAVNQVYSIPHIRQQISLPDLLGPEFGREPELAQLLAYDLRLPVSVEEMYQQRHARRGLIR